MAKYEFIESHKDIHVPLWTVVNMCAWLGVSRSGYCTWRTRPQSATAARRQALTLRIRSYFDDSAQTYGYRWIHADLVAEGTPASPELVRKIMADEGMIACQPRPLRVTTVPDTTDALQVPDLVQRDFTAATPGQKFVGDITYIHTWQEPWLILLALISISVRAWGALTPAYWRREIERQYRQAAAVPENIPEAR